MDSSEPKPPIKRSIERSYGIIYSKLKVDPASRHLRGPATAGALVVIAGPPVASRFALRRPDALKSPPTKALAQETAIPGPNRAGDHRTGSLAAGSHPLYRLKRAETPIALCTPPFGGRGALAQEVLGPRKCAREGCFTTPQPPRSHLAAHENARQHAAPYSLSSPFDRARPSARGKYSWRKSAQS